MLQIQFFYHKIPNLQQKYLLIQFQSNPIKNQIINTKPKKTFLLKPLKSSHKNPPKFFSLQILYK